MRVPTIHFYCNANSVEGLGHFMRCFNLFRLLKKSLNIKACFVGNYDEPVVKLLNKHKISYINNNLRYFLGNDFNTDLVIIDSYKLNGKILKKITIRNKVLIFDDFNNSNLYYSLGVINFTIGAKKSFYAGIPFKLTGIKFFPHDQSFQIIRKKNLTNPKVKLGKENLSILIILSGTELDKSKVFNLLRLIDKVYKNSTIYFINRTIINDTHTFLNKIIHIDFTDNISKYYKKADLAITGGGLTKYELSFCAIPNMTISINKGQHIETKQLKKYGLTYCIGSLFNFNTEMIHNNIEKFHKDSNWLNNFYEHSGIIFKENNLSNYIQKILNYERKNQATL